MCDKNGEKYHYSYNMERIFLFALSLHIIAAHQSKWKTKQENINKKEINVDLGAFLVNVACKTLKKYMSEQHKKTILSKSCTVIKNVVYIIFAQTVLFQFE